MRKPVSIPSILLESDAAPAPLASGPGQRYALAPVPPEPQPKVSVSGDLPEAYGTERLFLTARDPHWLYASWDLTSEQRHRYCALSREGQLVLRTHVQTISGSPAVETPLQPESKSWFVHVPHAGACYLAELGYYERNGRWKSITTSTATLTPPESMSEDTGVEFATIPPEVSLRKLFEVVQHAVTENAPLIETIQELRENGRLNLPQIVPPAAPEWTPAQARALSEVIRFDDSRRVWMGSLEITELVRRHLQQEISSAGPAAGLGEARPGLQPGQFVPAISSPLGPEESMGPGQKPFWLNVNAELVLYGATEPDARVTIGDREIRLRPDGTFSYRFALPDGEYPLAVAATSAEGADTRSTELRFSRSTQHSGEVGTHPQDSHLKPPHPADLT